tara:strand:+ start:733 stop:906 length:174 start_codon:yes stop_codon:yes gene_type:complete
MTVKHKEELVSSLNTLRADLMTMQAGITYENQIPNPDEIRAIVNKLELMIKRIENKD